MKEKVIKYVSLFIIVLSIGGIAGHMIYEKTSSFEKKDYYKNGKIFQTIEMTGKYKNGINKIYNENGYLEKINKYDYDELKWSESYHKNGKKESYVDFKDGKKYKYIEWDKYGNKIFEKTF